MRKKKAYEYDDLPDLKYRRQRRLRRERRIKWMLAIAAILVIIAMYMGRISPISMTFFFSRKATEKNNLSYAKGRYYIG